MSAVMRAVVDQLFLSGSAMAGGSWREKTENLANSVGKLHAQESENGNDHVEKNSCNEVTIPIQFPRLGAIEIAEQGVAIHLHGHVQSNADKGKNKNPIEKHDKLMRLKRIRAHGQQHKQQARQ